MGRLMLEVIVNLLGSLVGAVLTWFTANAVFDQEWEFLTVWIIWLVALFIGVVVFRVKGGDIDLGW